MKLFRLFLTHSWRYYRRHRILAALNIVGIALGITVFISIQIVNQSALNAFKASVDLVAGRANLSVEAEGTRFDESVYPLLKKSKYILEATPVVEEFCLLPDYPGQYLHILGVDPFSARALNVYELREQDQGAGLSFFSDPESIAVTEELADRLKLKIDDKIKIQTGKGIATLRIAALIKFREDAVGSSPELAVMDIANVQDRFSLQGKLNRIDCLVEPDWLNDPANLQSLKEELGQGLPGNARLTEPGRRGARVDKMVEAFQLNLTALSLIALVVGMFLIYNTMSATVVRRRAEIGLLRSIGLQAREVQALFLGEALLFGILGIVLGSVLGILLAQFLVGAVAQTLTSLYMLVRVNELTVSPSTVALAAFAGLGAVLAAAWFPSLEATKVKPVEALSLGHLILKSIHSTKKWTIYALGLLVLACLLGYLSLSLGWKWLSFGSALSALLGMAFFVPDLSKTISQIKMSKPLTLVLALRNFGNSLHRNSVTAAALVTAVSMVLGISIMIHSFRITVDSWIGRTIQADLYIAPASNFLIGMGERIPQEVVEKVKRLSQGSEFNAYREIRVQLGDQPVKLSSADVQMVRKHHRFRIIAGSDEGIEMPSDPQKVMVSEAFARQHAKQVGDRFKLATPDREKTIIVAAVYEDFTTDRGLIFMDSKIYQALWRDTEANSLALYFTSEIDSLSLQQNLSRELASSGQYLVYSNKKIRDEAMRIFDQTFAVTHLLRFISLLVAGIGIFLSISILTSERQREIAVLRAIGGSRSQVVKIILWESALLGSVSAILGTIGGFVLAVILTYVINVSFFGWTIEWATPWLTVLLTPLFVVLTALLSAFYPAWKAAHKEIANAVREE